MKSEEEGFLTELRRLVEEAEKAKLKRLMKNIVEPCEGCGAVLAGGLDRCWIYFGELSETIGRSSPERLRAYRMVSAIYFLQHPWKLKTPYSALSHLGKLRYLMADKNQTGSNSNYRNWLDDKRALIRVPEIPKKRGELTLMSLFSENAPAYDLEKIEAWADSVWESYKDSHFIASQALTL